jgi:hypothetical protein
MTPNRTGASSDALLAIAGDLHHAQIEACKWVGVVAVNGAASGVAADRIADMLQRVEDNIRLRAQSSVAPEVAAAPVAICAVCDEPNTYDPESGVCARCQDVVEEPQASGVAAVATPNPDAAQKVAGALGFILTDSSCILPFDVHNSAQKILEEYRTATAQPQPATGEPPKGMEAKAGSGPVAWQARPLSVKNIDWRECFEHDFNAKSYQGSKPGEWAFRALYAAPAAPERAEGQRVTEERLNELHRLYWAAYNEQHKRVGRTFGGHDAGIRAVVAATASPQATAYYCPVCNEWAGPDDADKWEPFVEHDCGCRTKDSAVVREGETKPAPDITDEFDPADLMTDAQVAHRDRSMQWLRLTASEQQRALDSVAQPPPPFDTTSPCGDPNVTVMARDAETGEPKMFLRKR